MLQRPAARSSGARSAAAGDAACQGTGGPALAAVHMQACSLPSCHGWCLSAPHSLPPLYPLCLSLALYSSRCVLYLRFEPPQSAWLLRPPLPTRVANTPARKTHKARIAPNLHRRAAASPLPVHACRSWVCCTCYMVGCMQPARSSGSVSCGAMVGRGCRGADPSCARPGRTGRAVRGTEHVWKRQRESRERGARTGYCDCGGRNVPLRRPSAGQPSPMRAAAAVGQPGMPPA